MTKEQKECDAVVDAFYYALRVIDGHATNKGNLKLTLAINLLTELIDEFYKLPKNKRKKT